MLRVLLVLCFVTVTYSETPCQTCFHKAKAAREQKLIARRKATIACFAKARCALPTETIQPNLASNETANPAMKTCIENAKSVVEKCVQRNFTAFTMPPEKSENHERHVREARESFNGHQNGQRGNRPMETSNNITHFFDHACSNGGNPNVLVSCLKTVEANYSNSDAGSSRAKNLLLDVLNNCSTIVKPAANCTAEYVDVMKTLCDCKKRNNAVFRSCFNNTNSAQQHDFDEWREDGLHERNYCNAEKNVQIQNNGQRPATERVKNRQTDQHRDG